MKPNHTPEAAVSPVVGIMLMLVVTIILAAVVSVFATGMAADATSGPNAQIRLSEISFVPGHQGYVFEHAGGDNVDLTNLQFRFTSGDCDATINYDDPFGFAGAYEVQKLNDSVTGGNKQYPRFQKVGVEMPPRYSGIGTSNQQMPDAILHPGEKFTIYFDGMYNAWGCYFGFVVGNQPAGGTDPNTGKSLGVYWGYETSYTFIDKESGKVIAQGTIPAQQKP